MVRVVVVDDNSLYRHGIIEVLQMGKDIQVVGEGRNGQEAIQAVKEFAPDILIMDISMPIMNGLEALSQIQTLETATRVIILTAADDEQTFFEARKNGAAGYMDKSVTPEYLFETIRRVANGDFVIPDHLATKFIIELSKKNENKRSYEDNESLIEPLTTREIQILQEMSTGASNHEMAERLQISRYSINSHVQNILNKLQKTSRAQAVIYALQKGIIKK